MVFFEINPGKENKEWRFSTFQPCFAKLPNVAGPIGYVEIEGFGQALSTLHHC